MKVITNIVEDFQDHIPEFQPESCIAGWEYFLDRLDSYLQNNFENNQIEKLIPILLTATLH